ncbi:SH3 domain-containing protein [Streptacidiphilus neutrinimicus]|uniref:SH3 domain-containing protein n=1 Tax=Streptacidiphilus neutrinimicus TaxID=105420 RepID=UPI0005A7DA3D|nr:SH3 domain-containing protein [Streptacidiphilus neutrinimicus]
MLLQSTLRKIATVTAAGALATVAAAGTASAAAPSSWHHHHLYKGQVIAKTGLLIRNAPNRNAKVVGSLAYGQIVWIKCKVNGETVDGNPRWYKLANGCWAWSSARYIENIGQAPRWCE